MALDGTNKGMRQAAQALARIGITQDPAIAFPGQRVRKPLFIYELPSVDFLDGSTHHWRLSNNKILD